jgi:hypothetical protein
VGFGGGFLPRIFRGRMKRVYAQLGDSNIESLQDAYYLVGQLVGIKIMNKFGAEYNFEYGLGMVIYRNRYGSVVISVSGDTVSITIHANGKKQDILYDKDEVLETMVNNIFEIWQAMLPVSNAA